jgi:hypothetical protein
VKQEGKCREDRPCRAALLADCEKARFGSSCRSLRARVNALRRYRSQWIVAIRSRFRLPASALFLL